MIPLPLSLKLLVPGYRGKWRGRYAGMLDHLNDLAPNFTYGKDTGVPWIEHKSGGPRFFGFWTEPANLEVFRLLGRAMPGALPRGHFRLVKDYINRYLYPHLRPDLKPDGFDAGQLFGFHGQHKDAIGDIEDRGAHEELTRAFSPAPDDIIIDCGAFLGFGEMRLAPELTHGHIYAIEASAECHRLLERNLTHNRIANVTALHRAVWNEITTMDLQSGYAQANSLVEEVHRADGVETVETITIDRIVDEYNLAKVDMLSLTLNGAEIEALNGARRTLDAFGPRIRLAGWYSREGKKIWQHTKAILEDHGYRVFVGPRGNVMALRRGPGNGSP